jgi:hypothetical protein
MTCSFVLLDMAVLLCGLIGTSVPLSEKTLNFQTIYNCPPSIKNSLMEKPSSFAKFLTSDNARRYMVNRFSVKRAWAEATGSADRLSILLGEDIKHFHEFRLVVRMELSEQPEHQPISATRWKKFLKSRIEILDYWSGAVNAFATFCAGVFAVAIVISRSFGPASNVYLVVAGIAVAGFALTKLRLDQHKGWYKYLVSHLEVIEMEK